MVLKSWRLIRRDTASIAHIAPLPLKIGQDQLILSRHNSQVNDRVARFLNECLREIAGAGVGRWLRCAEGPAVDPPWLTLNCKPRVDLKGCHASAYTDS